MLSLIHSIRISISIWTDSRKTPAQCHHAILHGLVQGSHPEESCCYAAFLGSSLATSSRRA